jgi:tricarballylate dehydrogenase
LADVVVVGAGNAALCAAIAASEAGASVVALEAAPRREAGGNSAYTAGAMRLAYRSGKDLRPLLDVPDRELALCDFGSYPVRDFVDDVERVTGGRADPELTRLIAREGLATLQWMREHGVQFEPSYGQQAFELEGRWRFWGGLAVRVRGEGKGLVSALEAGATAAGVKILYETRATELLPGRAVRVQTPSGSREVEARSLVLASGGFEANGDWRAKHLGPAWSRAKVRGTRFNTGGGIRMALEAGAAAHGDWEGAHAVQWDRDAPDFGDIAVAHEYTRNSYQFGIMVNSLGRRFADEGADFRNYTYAALGREVLAQPGGVAWQIFDAKVGHLLRREYERGDAAVVEASSLRDLASAMDVDGGALEATVDEFNRSIRADAAFDPAARDGRSTTGLAIPKSNWALPIDQPPFRAFAVCCGITFTFGGLRVDTDARVLDAAGQAIPKLFAAGELVGGIWYGNYAGGTGLTAGSVLGRIAGERAAAVALS